MTIVLGRRPAMQPLPVDQRRSDWVDHFRMVGSDTGAAEPTALPALPSSVAGGPSPVPAAEIHGMHRGIYASARIHRGASADGAIGIYAARLDAQSAGRLGITKPSALPVTRSFGRGTTDHYDSLYPSKNVEISLPEVHIPPLHINFDLQSRWQTVATQLDPRTWFKPVMAAFALPRGHRLSYSKRGFMLSLAFLVLMAGAAANKAAASQFRYEVQEGDTLQSIAADFDVDPDGIYRSSWMPYGIDVVPGQVVIIPEPGQSPAEAAQMAAELEGTSPWVVGAHYVQAGESFDTIATLWGVPVDHLMSFNPEYDPANLVVGDRIVIPWERDNDIVGPQITASPETMIYVPNYVQSRNLSCEFAATHAATSAFGYGVGEQAFIDSTPLSANPHKGYRGDIDGWWGNTDDYGVYADALVPTLNAYGFVGESFYSMGDTDILKEHLNAGHPVVVWLGFWGDTRVRLDDDGQYSVFAGMHVVTAVGYDDLGVYVMDPAKGVTRHYDWTTFSAMWSIIDGMGLAVYPE